MTDIGCAKTPVNEHVSRFLQYLETETVRITVNMRRVIGIDAPDGPVEYWDSATFSDDVAKSLVSEIERQGDMLKAWDAQIFTQAKEIERLRAALVEAKIGHHSCEDGWYSCPKSEYGCLDDGAGSDCNCGADEHNAAIDAALNHKQTVERE